MRRRVDCGIVGLTLWAWMGAALAQVPAPFVGTWNVSWQGKSNALSAKMVLTESGGRWQTFNVTSKADFCYGREVVAAVDSASEDAVTLKLKFSEALAGCNDVTVKLKRGEDGAVSGTRSGAPLTMVKQ